VLLQLGRGWQLSAADHRWGLALLQPSWLQYGTRGLWAMPDLIILLDVMRIGRDRIPRVLFQRCTLRCVLTPANGV
jgi:hypothetical protein